METYYQKKHYERTIYNWKKYGVICDDFNKLYEHHMSIDNCKLCKIEFNSDIRNQWRCLDHDHKTGLYRQTICHKCNRYFDTSISCRNITGHKNISFYTKRQDYVYEKMINGKRTKTYFKTLEEAVDFKNKFENKF